MDKIDRLLDAMEHPEHYSESEINAMFEDQELKEVFDLLDKTKSSLQSFSTPDMETEWNAFETRHRDIDMNPHTRIFSLFHRNIAAAIAIIIASVTAIAAVLGITVKYISNPKDDMVTVISDPGVKDDGLLCESDSLAVFEELVEIAPETVVFENERFEAIISEIAVYYGCEILFHNDAPKSLRLYFRWNQELTIEEVVERLNNFEHIHITVEDKTIFVD